MDKVRSTIYVEKGLIAKAKRHKINISAVCQQAIDAAVGGVDAQQEIDELRSRITVLESTLPPLSDIAKEFSPGWISLKIDAEDRDRIKRDASRVADNRQFPGTRAYISAFDWWNDQGRPEMREAIGPTQVQF